MYDPLPRRVLPQRRTALTFDLVRDAAITLSLALQHGVKIETLQHAVLRDSRGEPLSLVGAVIDELARVRS